MRAAWAATVGGMALGLSGVAGCAPAGGAAAPVAAGGLQGKLLLRVDVAASLAVDGHRVADLAPAEARAFSLAPGPRRVSLTSKGGEARWEETVELEAAQVVRLVELSKTVQEVRHDYVKIPAGRFEMGCVDADPECAGDERPRRPVTVDRGFWLMRSEVPVGAFEAFARAGGRPLPEAPSFNAGWKWKTQPVVNVTWSEAAAYCQAAGGRLPTEAEWEYAARGGQAGHRYVWGAAPRPVVEGYKQANVADQRAKGAFEVAEGPWFEGYDDGYSYTSPAFQYSANGFGLFDMAGNVWEWCAERQGGEGVLRGGSWATGVGGTRLSNRLLAPAQDRRADAGFRCARDVSVPEAAAEPAPPAASLERGEAPAPAQGEVRLRVDTAALLSVDGGPPQDLPAGQTRVLALAAGQHLLAVASRSGEARWERVVPVAGSPVEVAVELADRVEEVRRDYVRVPAGTFEMGCVPADAQCHANETPRHPVTLSRDFWMMRTEATVGAYRAFAQGTGRALPAESDTNPGWRLDRHPIMNLTWFEAADFCAGVGGRLPSEAEWEYAARGGRAGGRYAWGNAAAPLVDGARHANVGDERAKARVGCAQCGWFDGYDDGYDYTAPVGTFAANGFGLHDLAGNVSEWCADWYRERYYAEAPRQDPPGSEFGRWRVLRGGSWSMNPVGLRLSARGGFPPDRTTDNYGVRCVRDVAVP